jgi:NAD(P)-dependent dehydrogenase (short-subunit alcohol dehydrogenase family)
VGSLLLKPAHLTKPQEWADTVSANLTSSFAVLRAAVQPMMRQKQGSVVLVSSAAAAIGLANHEAIAAAKGGIDALVRSAAATYGRSGVRVNAVAPGLVETPLTERITKSGPGRGSSEAMHALGRIGEPEDIAAAMAWLLGSEADWVTGQTLGVDGGLGRVRSA